MDAIVTAKFRFSNVCNKEDLDDMTFEEMVKYLIAEEGLMGVVDDSDGEIISVEEAPAPPLTVP